MIILIGILNYTRIVIIIIIIIIIIIMIIIFTIMLLSCTHTSAHWEESPLKVVTGAKPPLMYYSVL